MKKIKRSISAIKIAIYYIRYVIMRDLAVNYTSDQDTYDYLCYLAVFYHSKLINLLVKESAKSTYGTMKNKGK